jgi:hypothetical protein
MMSARKAAMERMILFSIAAVYCVQQLTRLELLTPVLGSLVLIAVLLLLPKLKGMTLWLAIVFMAIGSAFLLAEDAGIAEWFEAASMNVTIVTLFLFAPLFGIPVRAPDYIEALRRYYETNLRRKRDLFIGTQILTQLLGAFINVGSIPVVYQMVNARPQQGMSGWIANALNRGFAGAIFWSPYFAAMTLVTSALAVSWVSILPYMLGLAAMSLAVSWLVDLRELRSPETDEATDESVTASGKASFPPGLGLYLLLSMLVILAMERTVKLPMVMLVCMAALIVPLLWCIAKRRIDVYREGVRNHVFVTLPALQKEIALFLSAGFFSGSIGATGFGSAIPALLGQVSVPIAVTFSVFAVALIAGTSLIGLHPIVPVTVLASGIAPSDVQISPIYYAVLLLGSWALSNPVSPASAVNNLLAGLLQKPVFEVARQNYKFAACMAIVLLLYLTAIGGYG